MVPKGWHSYGYLPHFDSPETVQFVTFRLADSLPASVVESIRLRDHALPRLDRELDAGLGACWLRRSDIASLVEGALLHFDGERYRLFAWCVMPNHVHAVTEIMDGHSLTEIVGSWKSFTAKRANSQISRTDRLGIPITLIAICGRGPSGSDCRICRKQPRQGGACCYRVRLALELSALWQNMSGPEARGPRGRSAR